jgi:hypothetical protein
MSDTARLCELLQAHAQLLSIRIAAEGTKEYKADWLKNADTVVRDGSGKFAKKGTSSATPETPTPGQPPTVQEKVGQAVSDTKKVTSLLLEGGEVTVEMLKKLLTDKDFRRRAGLEVGQTGAQAIKRLAEAAKVNPEFTKKLDSYINKFNQDLIKEYGDDGGAMAQAIRKHGNLPPGKDLKERLELHVAKYKALEDALESPEVYKKEDPKPVQSVQQQLISAAIPLAISIGAAIAPEIIFAGAAFSLTECLISAAAGEAASWAASQAVDKLDIDPMAKLGISLAVGALAGGTPAAIFQAKRIKKAKDIAVKNVGDFKYSLESHERLIIPVKMRDVEYVKESLIDADSLRRTLKQDKYVFSKQVEDIDNVIQGLESNLDEIKRLSKLPSEYSVRLLSPAASRIEAVIQKLNTKKSQIIGITDDLYKDADKVADEISDKQIKYLESQIKGQGDGVKGMVDQSNSLIDLMTSVGKQQSLIDRAKSEVSEYYKGWGDLYKELEDAYRESAMTLNRYHLDIDSKSIQYGDEVAGLERIKRNQQLNKELSEAFNKTLGI